MITNARSAVRFLSCFIPSPTQLAPSYLIRTPKRVSATPRFRGSSARAGVSFSKALASTRQTIAATAITKPPKPTRKLDPPKAIRAEKTPPKRIHPNPIQNPQAVLSPAVNQPNHQIRVLSPRVTHQTSNGCRAKPAPSSPVERVLIDD